MNTIKLLSVGLLAGFCLNVGAAADKAVAKAEAAMLAACKKEFPAAVKGKKFKDVAEWVETEERGTNADTFKKSKCYDLHEKWETVAGNSEKGESTSDKK